MDRHAAREHFPNAVMLDDVEGEGEGLAVQVHDDGTAFVLAFADHGDSWHGARVNREALLRALGGDFADDPWAVIETEDGKRFALQNNHTMAGPHRGRPRHFEKVPSDHA